MATSFTIDDREFKKTLAEYVKICKSRTFPEIVNTKAFFICRGAARNTFRPSKGTIQRTTGRLIFDLKRTKTGRSRRVLVGSSRAATKGVPIAALIQNWRAKKMGKPGKYGKAMKTAIKKMIGARSAARAFIASGWIPAIKALAPLAKYKRSAPPTDNEAKQRGKPKGSAKVAVGGGYRVEATITNSASSKVSTTKDPLQKYGKPALVNAFDEERRSMIAHMEEKLLAAAKSAGIKTN